tara:strand:+ start:295 stop:588 length:294 start_codon:yes stop_codon:yes gene_type:complete
MSKTDKKEWQISTGSVDELNEAMVEVLALLEEPGRSHGIDAGKKLMTTLIEAGVTTAACGSLDLENARAFSVLLQHPEALNKVARKMWWGEDIEVFE